MTSEALSEREKRDAKLSRRRRHAAALAGPLVLTVVIMVLAIIFAIASARLGGYAGRFPFAVAILTLTFCLLELARQFLVIRSAHRAGGEEAGRKEAGQTTGGTFVEKTKATVWFVLTLTGVLLAGVLITSFLSATAYYRWIDGQSRLGALLAGIGLTLGLWLVFDVLAGFTLFRGLLR